MKVGMGPDGTGADMPTRRAVVGAVQRVSKAGSVEDGGGGWIVGCHSVDAVNMANVA
jgi:hypothetical protein